MIEFIKPYYNQAKEIAKHFSPYNPEDSNLSIEYYDAPSDSEPGVFSSSSSGLDNESMDFEEYEECDEEIITSQFTLVGSSQTNFNCATSLETQAESQLAGEQCQPDSTDLKGGVSDTREMLTFSQEEVLIESSDYLIRVNDQQTSKAICVEVASNMQHIMAKSLSGQRDLCDDQEEFDPKNEQMNRKAVWADNMAKIIDEYLIEDSPLRISEGGPCLEMESSIEILSKAESTEPLYNTPASEDLDFDEVSRQIYDLDQYFNQSEAFYAEQCAAYWDARGWLPAIEANECDEEILDSIEYHKRVLLDRVKTRLEIVNRDRANRELLFKVSSFFESEEICRQIAEEAAKPKNEHPKQTMLQNLSDRITSCYDSSKQAAGYIWQTGSDILYSCSTMGIEIGNIILGEEFSIIECMESLTKSSPKDLLMSQIQIQKQILNETLEVAKNIVTTWWNIRIKMYKALYSAGYTLVSSSISELSHSTSPGARLSSIISKLSGLFRS